VIKIETASSIKHKLGGRAKVCKNLELFTPHMGYNRTQNQRSNGELEGDISRNYQKSQKPILKNAPYPA
jgi:hypothetical protein